MAFGNGYIFGFATTVCIVCSLGVATASQSLKSRQDTNVRRDFQSNILSALGLPEDGEPLKGELIDKLYEERVEVIVVNADGSPAEGKTISDVEAERAAAKAEKREPTLLAVYVRMDGDDATAYALPAQGVGLWGPISGFVALEPDAETVKGTTFFAPKETPGLGYEITTQAFRDQWKGKKVFSGGDLQPVKVVKGAPELACPGRVEHCVQGISGATITSDGVTDMVEESLNLYEPYLRAIRGNR